jgi:Saxitoxin biosynthesis operon protein SxtJ
MSEHEHHIDVRIGSEKNFGIVFAVVFLVIGFWPLVNSQNVRYWCLAISAAFLLVAFYAPNILSLPNKIWFKFGMLIGGVVAPVVMAMVYFLAVLPTGVVMKLLGKDILHQNIDKDAESY